MSNIYVEREGEKYVAFQNKKPIAQGNTQRQTIDRARRVSPEDPVLAERQRMTDKGSRDKWRRVY